MLYPLAKHIAIGPALRRYLDIRVDGIENIPDRGALIVAANHHAEVDSLVLALASPRRLAFFAKAEYFRAPGLRGIASRSFFSWTGQIPVDRAGDPDALDAATRLLHHGGAWAIYPEGTRSPDHSVHRGHTGALRVADRVPDCSIVPVHIAGTHEVNPPGPRRLFRGPVTVTIGRPVSARALLRRSGDVRTATDHLMHGIADLGAVPYVDVYAQPRTRSATA
ncbi:lysophospholipid acyltransferase family protein [Gordonia shandongensis]|uniref:lysophospholipid acyltransferase family protein n=1 Tax=Gordonia shandongensis TaxID=376351 RepID=UPI00041FADB9|nr:lysophospholipid acyltransferase family protein [Gordonia shandongensis]